MDRDLDYLRGQGTAIRLLPIRAEASVRGGGPGLALHSGGREALALAESERWFLVHTHPKGERKAQLHLGAQGFRTHLPQIRKTIRHARQLRTVRTALFPRYLFIILDLGRDPWLSVRSTVGVSSLFSCDDRPIPVPQGAVEGLIEHTDEAALTLFQTGLSAGQSVRILTGPFANFVGTLERLDDAGRVRVLLEMMGTAVPVALHRSALSPAA
jgi:transcription elongation factor/antiterminator RfaH